MASSMEQKVEQLMKEHLVAKRDPHWEHHLEMNQDSDCLVYLVGLG